MTHTKLVLNAFTVARSYLKSLFAVHMTFQLLGAAVIGPVFGIIFALAIQFSNQKALTDMDIAAFVLSPIGFIISIVVFSFVLAAVVLDFTATSFVLFTKTTHPVVAVQRSFGFVLSNFFRLVWFCNGLVLRVFVIVTPFLVVAAGIGLNKLTEFDINYYLTYWPPEFIRAVGMIAVLLVIMVGILLFFLSGWAIALHLYLARDLKVGLAFKESRRLLAGKRFGLVVNIALWALIRFAILTVIALIFTKLTSVLLDHAAINLRLMVGVLLLEFLVWGGVYMVASAFANGALAEILLRTYSKATKTAFSEAIGENTVEVTFKKPLWAILAGAVGVVTLGVFLTGAMLEKFDKTSQVEIIAHRGAANLRPENTMAAVEKALEDGTDWVEIDVQESAEGELIIAHDSDFMKLANQPIKTWEVSRTELDAIDIGSWFDAQYADERTPLLRDVLQAAKGRAKVVIELKYYGHDVDIEAEVIRIVEEEGMAEQVSLMSLKYPAVLKLKAMRPSWTVGVLAAKSVGNVARLEADFLALNAGQISRQLIRRAHAQGKDVYAWTVDDPVQMSSLITMGVDGLITNDPALARRVLEYNNDLTAAERLVLWVADFIQLSPLNLIADSTDA
ncbi:glycerophosphodiester phosphodiesterase family protein [Falsihalocynthiibacter arcticus]|uniref:GP-PDE domain-containing protein n=1 Tax=Falsihalocynthiibacter arcticus TaxID=1579316 RepID=A0A126V2K1_9RHOB|nr:glycerophosphodiester phosphodiesterase family protein [Falsihalocynthiibacter arcticus]AML52551.1 hypothetical protein RC74_15880 [Falsihalocynthiibacter arcticus]